MKKAIWLCCIISLITASGCQKKPESSGKISSVEKSSSVSLSDSAVSDESSSSALTSSVLVPSDSDPASSAVQSNASSVSRINSSSKKSTGSSQLKASSKPTVSQNQTPSSKKPVTLSSKPGSGDQNTQKPDDSTGEESFSKEAQEILDFVNVERGKAGVPALKLDLKLTQAAQIRADEIVVKFDHVRPDGRKWDTVLDEFQIKKWAWGENIYMDTYPAPSAERAMNGWMNSSGHRANILNGNFSHLGVGMVQKNDGNYWVQLFIKK